MHLNRELEDTNRGVVALYAELDEKADHLRRADELKSRFLSNMTHEFRTPVNSILGLSSLLLDDRQRLGREAPSRRSLYIRKAAEQLSELVNDLLDLAKVEAGKTVVRPAEFSVENLFGALRGMLRPLLLNQSVSLVFEDATALPPLYTDEGKVSQILRNLISNALKFTERGEVRVTAGRAGCGRVRSRFSVADTGIGIAPQDQARIFEEFTQLEHRLQSQVRGTGLGLPLSRRLAELLGGTSDGDERARRRFDLHAARAGALQRAARHGGGAASSGSRIPASCRCSSSRMRRTRSTSTRRCCAPPRIRSIPPTRCTKRRSPCSRCCPRR